MTKGVRRAGKTLKDSERRRLGKARRAERAPEPARAPAGAATLWCDGGSRGNPGPAACGFVLEDADGRQLASVGEAIGQATVAVAEYRAVLAGLHAVADLGLAAVEVRTDSRLVVRHLMAERPLRNPALAALRDRARATADGLAGVTYRWVRADENARADALVAALLD